MVRFDVVTSLVTPMNSCGDGHSAQAWASLAIALSLFAILIYRELTHRRRIQALMGETQSMKMAFEEAPIGMAIVSLEGRWLRVNRALCTILGYSEAEMLAQTFQDITHPDDLEKSLAHGNQALAGQVSTYQVEKRYIHKLGHTVWVLLNASLTRDAQHQPLYFIAQIQDITDRKHSEKRLRESEARLKTLIDNLPFSCWICDAEGRHLLQNTADIQQWGNLAGLRYEEGNLPPEVWSQWLDNRRRVLAGEVVRSESQYRSGDRLQTFFNILAPIHHDNAIQGFVGVSIDMTEQKQAEDALRKSEERYRAFIEQSSEGIWCFEAESAIAIDTPEDEQIELIAQNIRLVECNDAFVKMYGFSSAADLIGKRCGELLVHSDPHNREYLRSFIRSGYRFTDAESHEIDSTGQIKYILNNSIGIVENGYLVRLWGTQRDITDRKQAEHALHQKEKFLQLILDNIPQQIFWKDRELTYLGCNRHWAKTAGLEDTAEIVGKNDYDLPWEPGEADYYIGQDQRVLETGQPILNMIEHKLQANGERMWVRVDKVPIPDVNGHVIGVLGTIENITERKQAEEAQRSRNQKLLTLYRISEAALSSQSSRSAFQHMAEEISIATEFPIVAIELYDEARQVMVFEGMKGISMAEEVLEVPVEQTLSGTVAKTGQAIVKHYAAGESKLCDTHQTLSQLNLQTFICLPMSVNQMTIGVLSLAHPDIIQPDDSVLTWLESLANYLAVIAHRKQLEASLQQANVQLGMKVAEQTAELREAIAQLQQEIHQRHQTEAALRESEERFRRIFDNAPIGIAVARVSDYQFLMVNQAFCQLLGYTESELLDLSYPAVSHPDDLQADKPLAMQMLAGKINSYQVEKRYRKKNQQALWATLTATAVRDRTGEVLYVVGMVQDITERKQAEWALQDAHEKLTARVSDLERRHQEIMLLNEMSDFMQACLTLDEAYTVIAQFMSRLFPDCAGAVYTINESKTLVEQVTTWGEDLGTPDRPTITSQPLFTPNECFALRRGQPHYVEDTHTHLCCKHVLSPLPPTYYCVPMVAQGEASGVLHLSMSTHALTPVKQQLATTVARQIALAIANLKLYATLQNQSIRDPLTGLFNRRYLNEFLERELRRAERNQECLSILLLDVDHFKLFNDTFGHDAGDAVLRHLSEFLQEHIRGSDIACRYGGEELVLVLPGASLDHAMQRAEQLRQGVKHLHVDYPQPLGSITVSIGVACFPTHGLSGAIVLQAADMALYHAKATGRDRVVMASQSILGVLDPEK